MNAARKNTRFLTWLALCALVVLQIAVFQHQSAHAADDITDSCEICVQLNGSKPLVGCDDAQQLAPAQFTNELCAFLELALADRYSDRSTRGPPLILI